MPSVEEHLTTFRPLPVNKSGVQGHCTLFNVLFLNLKAAKLIATCLDKGNYICPRKRDYICICLRFAGPLFLSSTSPSAIAFCPQELQSEKHALLVAGTFSA